MAAGSTFASFTPSWLLYKVIQEGLGLPKKCVYEQEIDSILSNLYYIESNVEDIFERYEELNSIGKVLND